MYFKRFLNRSVSSTTYFQSKYFKQGFAYKIDEILMSKSQFGKIIKIVNGNEQKFGIQDKLTLDEKRSALKPYHNSLLSIFFSFFFFFWRTASA